MIESPSKDTNNYWIRASPSTSKLEKIILASKFWFEKNADTYVNSRKIYQRDIYSDEMIVPRTEIDKTLIKIDHEAIEIAKSKPPEFFKVLFGKWLLFVPRKDVDEVWVKISSKIESGRLPYPAKVATAKEKPYSKSKNHVICVYTPNYFFREDVRNCRNALKKLGFEDILYYKPDIFTYKRMYRIYGSIINHRYFG